jgi:hypothetical protein
MNTQEDKNFALEMMLDSIWTIEMARDYLASNEYKCINLSPVIAEIIDTVVLDDNDTVSALHDVELARQYASRRANRSNGDYIHAVFERAFIERLKYLGYSRYEDAIDATVIAMLERSKAKQQRKHG